MTHLTGAEARRIALAAQGFDRPRPSGPIGLADLRGVIRRLGLLQIDYVNVLLPAQYQVPFSRLGPYATARLDRLVYHRREFTEQWAHEASIVPVDDWPLLRHHRNERRARFLAAFMARHARTAARALDEIRSRGALAADELPASRQKRPRPDFWGWTIEKGALEGHFTDGTLAVADRRPDFARRYDLAERVIPRAHLERRVARDEALRELVRRSARALGVATADDLADYYRLPVRETRPRVADLVASGELREVRVDGWPSPAYLHAQARLPRRLDACALVSPFDPVVWYRPRVARLFGFDYRLEIWVPRARRRWGYYVLPFLMGDRLVARVDLKADRAARRLAVLGAYGERHATPREVAGALATELATFSAWLGLGSVAVSRRGDLAGALAAAVRDRTGAAERGRPVKA